MKLAPITVFCYNRLDNLKSTITALQNNRLASESDLIIFSDGPKNFDDKKLVSDVRDFIKTITGFKTIAIYESHENKGLAKSIIEGVSFVLSQNENIIVLEDDLITSYNFLDYMNQSLHYYDKFSNIFTIAGYSIPISSSSKFDVYFTHRSFSWGWATWKNRWKSIDWEVKTYDSFHHDKKSRYRFNKMGSDMSRMLDKQMKQKIDSWAIRWCYHQFVQNLYSVHPISSKIINIGFNPQDASNTKAKFNPFETSLDASNKIDFYFSETIKLEKSIVKQFTKPFSIISRIKYKILNLFS
jgi:hypothetical protein